MSQSCHLRPAARAALRALVPCVALLVLAGCGGSAAPGGGGSDGSAPPGSDTIILGGDAVVPPHGLADTAGGVDAVAAPDGAVSPDVAHSGPDVVLPPDVPGPPDVPAGPDHGQPPACGYGDIIGVVCSPNGTVFINDALVYVETIDCDGQPIRIETTSDAVGEYTLRGVPSGLQNVEIRKGSFQHTVEVPVQAGVVNDLRGTLSKLCFGARSARIAVVSGTYDSIQGILDGLGVEYDLISDEPVPVPPFFLDYDPSPAHEFLLDPERLAEYHILFLNCSDWSWINLYGEGQEDATAIANNLSAFVHNGGSLYASDWAFAFVERPWPGVIDFVGNDAVEFGCKVGEMGMYTGAVTDASLAAFLGKDEVRINFDLMQWVVMDGVSGAATVHIEANIPQAGGVAPLMVSFAPYELGGRVLFTSFHNEQQVTDDMGNILNFLVFSL